MRLEGNLLFVGMGVERDSISFYLSLEPIDFIALVQRILPFAQPCPNFLYTQLSCCFHNAFTLQETGNIKYLQGGEIRKRDCQNILSSAKSQGIVQISFSFFLSEEDQKWLLDIFKVIFLIRLLEKDLVSAILYRKK